jgi:hypothetical protein
MLLHGKRRKFFLIIIKEIIPVLLLRMFNRSRIKQIATEESSELLSIIIPGFH